MSAPPPPGVGTHATCIIVGEAGILILGPSGSGKTALALALIARARDARLFAALVGDDRVWLRPAHGRLVAAGAPHMAGRIERRGMGIVAVDWEPASVIRLAISLSPRDAPWPRYPEAPETAIFQGVETPLFLLDGRSAAVDNAEAALDRVRMMAKGSSAGKRISLEQCAAVHKNRQLASSPAASPGTGEDLKPGD